MVPGKKYGAFISYSHDDAYCIVPVIQLIQAMRTDLVFQDKKDLQPGKPWEAQLQSALNDCEIIIVFWCNHSAKSSYVRKEFQTAIEKQKDVLPILLDFTVLDKQLSAYQWIDFRGIQFPGHGEATVANAPMPLPSPPPLSKKRAFIPLSLAALTAISLAWIILKKRGSSSSTSTPSNDGHSWITLIVVAGIIILAAGYLFKRVGKRKSKEMETKTAAAKVPSPNIQEVNIAQAITEKLNEKLPPK